MVHSKRPVIGVLAQEISRKVIPESITGNSYIASSYVKYLEAAGADVIPILIDATEQEIEELFYCINGILIPGGGASLSDSKYISNARIVYNMAKQANNNGIYFPIWGTCLGFEALAVLETDASVLDACDAIDVPLPLEFSGLAKESKMLHSLPKELFDIYVGSPVTYNYHQKCLATEKFSRCPKLQSMFKVLACNHDRNGKQFVSAVEGRSEI